jgi:hypothetical protein
MRLWIEVHSKNDKRYLLVEYDESIDENLLTEAYDKIAAEDEKLSGTDAFQKHYHDADRKLWDGYNVNIILLTIKCLELNRKDLAQKIIDDFKLKVKIDHEKVIDKAAIDSLLRLLKSINNRQKMKELRDKGNVKPDVTWESIQVYIHEVLGLLPDYNCTVALCREYQKSTKRKIEQQKSK